MFRLIRSRQLLNNKTGEVNPVIAAGEIAWDTVGKRLVVGDGVTPINDLDDIGGYVGRTDVLDPEVILNGQVLVYNAETNILEYKTLAAIDPTEVGLVGTQQVLEGEGGPIDGQILRYNENQEALIYTNDIIDLSANLNKVVYFLNNRVKYGIFAGEATTPSTHGDGVAYDFNVNITAGEIVIGGISNAFEAVDDFDVAHGEASPLTETDDTIFYNVVAKIVEGNITLVSVAGVAAPAASAVTPSEEDIDTAVSDAPWIRLFSVKVTRTGAATIALVLTDEKTTVNLGD